MNSARLSRTKEKDQWFPCELKVFVNNKLPLPRSIFEVLSETLGLFALPKWHGSQWTNLLTALIYHSVEVDNWDNKTNESNNEAFFSLVWQCRQEIKRHFSFFFLFFSWKGTKQGSGDNAVQMGIISWPTAKEHIQKASVFLGTHGGRSMAE